MSYHSILTEAVDQHLERDPELLATIYSALRKLRQGFYSRKWVDVLFQDWREEVSIYDAYYFTQMHTLALGGQILSTEIDVGATPGPNSDLEGNREKLWNISRQRWYQNDNGTQKRMPAGTFRARYDPGTGATGDRGDGDFTWHRPLHVGAYIDNERPKNRTIPPGWLPLEVGYTKVTTTWMHIRQNGGVARWPYGSEVLHILIADPGCGLSARIWPRLASSANTI